MPHPGRGDSSKDRTGDQRPEHPTSVLLTGCPSGSLAQDLADELGVTVLAPTTEVGASSTGKTMTIFDGGRWLWFEPTQRR